MQYVNFPIWLYCNWSSYVSSKILKKYKTVFALEFKYNRVKLETVKSQVKTHIWLSFDSTSFFFFCPLSVAFLLNLQLWIIYLLLGRLFYHLIQFTSYVKVQLSWLRIRVEWNFLITEGPFDSFYYFYYWTP